MNEYFKPFFNPWHYSWRDYRELRFWKWTIENLFYHNPRAFIKWVKWFFQRGSRGWADCDWWSMNGYICTVIVPMLKRLKESGMGYPGVKGATTPEEWNERLDEMIAAFEAAERVIEDEYYETISPDFPEKKASRKEVLQWIAMNKADQRVFKKKFKVFTKYFFALWD